MLIKVLCNRIFFLGMTSKSAKMLHSKSLKCQLLDGCPGSWMQSSRNVKNFPIILTTRTMAGHSKWQNVKHVKAEKDRQKNILCNRYVRLATAAVREKGPDPKLNNKLASVLEEAKRNNIPYSTMEGALKRASNKKSKPGTVEIFGPGGSFIIVDYETDNVGDMRHSLKVLCKKYGSSIMSGEGRWRAAYEQKGIIKVTSPIKGENFDAENMLDAAIEAGAEDVQKREDENDKLFYEFISAVEDLHAVKKEIEKNYSVEEAYIGYLPLTFVSISDEDMVLASKFLDELNELPDVVRIFENIE